MTARPFVSSLVCFLAVSCSTATSDPSAPEKLGEVELSGDDTVVASSELGSCYCAQPYTCGHSSSPSRMYSGAHDAMLRAGVGDGSLIQTFGDAAASVGTHCPEPDSSYSAATDIDPGSSACSRVHELRMQGFAAYYRTPPSFGYHIHMVYAGTPSLKSQLNSFADGRNGLANNDIETHCPITQAERNAVNAVRNGGGTVAGNSHAIQMAFQANTGALWTTGSEGMKDWGLGMAGQTSPSITSLAGGGFQVAFQANTSSLITVGEAGAQDWHLGMMAGTSPSIAGLENGSFVVAFQSNNGSLWTVGPEGGKDWHLGMWAGTSPSITALKGGGYEVAFQANTTSLWTVGTAESKDWGLGMMPGTSPAIAGLVTGGYEVAFQANTTALWTVGTAESKDWGLGMSNTTSPAIVGLEAGGYQVAFQANTSSLITVGSAGAKDWALGMMSGTSPTLQRLNGSNFKVGFQANTSELWQASTSGASGPLGLGMAPGTSPSGT